MEDIYFNISKKIYSTQNNDSEERIVYRNGRGQYSKFNFGQLISTNDISICSLNGDLFTQPLEDSENIDLFTQPLEDSEEMDNSDLFTQPLEDSEEMDIDTQINNIFNGNLNIFN